MKSFSQRKNLKPVLETIQTDSMSDDLRNSLWNVLDIELWTSEGFLFKPYNTAEMTVLSKRIWFNYFKRPLDLLPHSNSLVLAELRNYFFACPWFEVYDFLEFLLVYFMNTRPKLINFINSILERELSGFRFVSGHFSDITNAQELDMLGLALKDSQFAGVSAHLQRGLELYANRENPDYRNSIKESISAVESMARIVAENPKATLSDALKAIEKRGSLHPALKDGFIKLYGYTSDEGGIRHAMLDEPELTSADARYFLLSCTSFVNYLKAQLAT
ncbi:MAG: AbiJ-NTD4 domain-containing protein [Methylophilaceae bacterium]